MLLQLYLDGNRGRGHKMKGNGIEANKSGESGVGQKDG